MSPRTKVLAGSLVGAVAIHVTFMACTGGPPMSADAGHDSGSRNDAGVFDALIDAARDALGMETREASAQSEAGTPGCGACTVSGPVEVQATAPLRTVTAETDPAQAVGGSLIAPTQPVNTLLAAGPFFLTDLRALQPASFVVHVGTDCSSASNTDVPEQVGTGGSNPAPIHGGHIFVPAGSVLCVLNGSNQSVWWSGYRPYATP